MGEKCLKQYHTYHECYSTSNTITLSKFLDFSDLGLKYHLPRLQGPVWGDGCCHIPAPSLLGLGVYDTDILIWRG